MGRRKGGLFLAICATFGLGVLLLSFDTAHHRPAGSEVPLSQQPSKSDRRKLILFPVPGGAGSGSNSTQIKGSITDAASLCDAANKLCPRCEFTFDQGRWHESDAIWFNGYTLEAYPPYKPPDQVWVYYFRDAPPMLSESRRRDLKNYRRMFNWMMTYRRDSDVYMPYRRLQPADPKKFDKKKALARFKKKKSDVPAAWIVSHCKTDSKREVLVEKLSKLVPADIYGECGALKCETPRSKSVGTDCRKQLADKYKFYLAFENCLCEEYVTEKFFDVLSTDMVPIVYSGANYTALGVPPGSYINVADYGSLEELAQRILWLAEHPEEYLGYLQARAGIKAVSEPWAANWCQICDKLTSGGPPSSSQQDQTQMAYEDVVEWLDWSPTSDGDGSGPRPVCISPPEFVIR